MVGKAVEALMHRLGKTGRRYRLQTLEVGKVPDLFQIAEKAPPGEVWKESGTNWRTFRGPSAKQMRMLEGSSRNLQEMVDRLEGFVLRGEDTVTPVVQQGQISPYNEDAITKLVAAKVAEILADRQKMSDIVKGEVSLEEAASTGPMTKIPKMGLQPKRARMMQDTARERSLATIKERLDILGIPHDQVRFNGSGKLNKLWSKQLDVMWAQYCAKNVKSTGDALAVAGKKPEASA